MIVPPATYGRRPQMAGQKKLIEGLLECLQDVVCYLQRLFVGNLVLVENLHSCPLLGMCRCRAGVSHLINDVLCSEDAICLTVRLAQGLVAV